MQLPADKYLDAYQDNLLHLLTLLQSNADPTSLLQQGKTGWDSVLFQPFLEAERRDILNLTKPLEVEEGLYTCPKCKSKKTHSYTRQVRSADEPATTFITCANTDCSYKWKIG
jgi:DNA-directed RNA polymerase subunit M/transcription elongation factor TFIIS